MNEDGKLVACHWRGRWNDSTGRNIGQVLLYPPQIPHGLAWTRARLSTVESLWLTFWATTGPAMVQQEWCVVWRDCDICFLVLQSALKLLIIFVEFYLKRGDSKFEHFNNPGLYYLKKADLNDFNAFFYPNSVNRVQECFKYCPLDRIIIPPHFGYSPSLSFLFHVWLYSCHRTPVHLQ